MKKILISLRSSALSIVSVLTFCGVLTGNGLSAFAQQNDIRTGWTFGVLPSFSYDADLGLQLGALTNIYYFGSGNIYPEYYHSFYAEAATTSTHYGLFRLSYDSKYLIPKHRLSIDVAYMPDKMCDFYGYNGYQTFFDANFIDNVSADYITRAYYKMQRDLFRACADLQGSIHGHWYWNAGLGILNYTVGTVDVEALNRYTKNPDNTLPVGATTLYDKYVADGLISAAEAHGGFHPYLHGGVTFDTRNRQQNPTQGIHADAFLQYNAAFGEMSDYNNLKFNAAWRHYLPIANRITFAYRLGTQLNVAGQTPFYLNTYINQLYMQRVIYEGIGGANSVRGIMRNRVLANGFAYANIEFRLQVAKFKIGKENFYIGLNPFLDCGEVLQPYDLNNATISDIRIESDAQALHLSAGCGLKVAMNDNFVLSVDWATALNEQDNYKFSNLYIKMGYMF